MKTPASNRDANRDAKHFEGLTNKSALYVTVYSRPDREGRQSFMLEWWMEGFHAGPQWRCQMFKALLARYVGPERECFHDLTPIVVESYEE